MKGKNVFLGRMFLGDMDISLSIKESSVYKIVDNSENYSENVRILKMSQRHYYAWLNVQGSIYMLRDPYIC